MLKIKPPLPLAASDARRLVAALDRILAEDAFRVGDSESATEDSDPRS